MRIPTLAIHLDRQETFSFNKESQLFPIAGLVEAELSRTREQSDIKDDEPESVTSAPSRHHPFLVQTLAAEIGVQEDEVVDFELSLFDTQKPCIGGLNDEFLFSARLE